MTKNLRTTVIGVLAAIGLLVGATFALAQSNDDPTSDTPTTTLEEIAEDLEADVGPLLDEIKAKALEAIDDAEAAGALTGEQADAAREGVEGYGLPEGFPFRLGHRLPWFGFDEFEPGCFRFGPDATDVPEECAEFPEGFPFEGHEFQFGPIPGQFDPEKLEQFSADIEEFIEDLDFDFEQLEELLESGMNPEEALDEMGLDLEAVLSDVREAALEKIDELVAEGTVSEEKAAMLREMLEGIDLPAGFPFGLHHFDFDPGDFGGWGPPGHLHWGEDPEED